MLPALLEKVPRCRLRPSEVPALHSPVVVFKAGPPVRGSQECLHCTCKINKEVTHQEKPAKQSAKPFSMHIYGGIYYDYIIDVTPLPCPMPCTPTPLIFSSLNY